MAAPSSLFLLLLVLNIPLLAKSSSLLNKIGKHDAHPIKHTSCLKFPSQEFNKICKKHLKEAKPDPPTNVDKQLKSNLSRSEIIELYHKLDDKASIGSSAFTVELSSHRSLSNEVPITFDDVLIDPNDNFIPLMGTFVCPDNDFYAFYWTIGASEGRVAAALVKQGELVKYGPLTSDMPGTVSGTSSMSALVQCSVGEMIWLKAQTWPDEDACNKIEGIYSSMTAFKVFRSGAEDAVGFTAEISSNRSAEIAIMIYDTVLVNVGGAYNPSTGIFVCPSDGVYVFSASAHGTSGIRVATYLYVNGNIVCQLTRPRNTGASTTDTGTNTGSCVVECDEGDSITSRASTEEHLARTTSLTGYCLNEGENNIIAFSARLSTGNNEYRDGQTLMFDHVITNVGNQYVPNAGWFMCNDTSNYMLIWRVALNGENDGRPAEARLVTAKDQNVEHVKSGPKTSELASGVTTSVSSTQAIVQCKPLRSFYIQVVIHEGSFQIFYELYTYFSGFRLPAI